MPPTADLRNLGERLDDVLGELRRAGFYVDIYYSEGSNTCIIEVDPLSKCPTCNRISPAAACLWCTPAEDDNEWFEREVKRIHKREYPEGYEDADPGGHGD